RLRHRRRAPTCRTRGRGRLPHRESQLLLPCVRERRGARTSVTTPARPSLEGFRELAREHTVVPVWCEVLADFETPLSAFVKLVANREGFLLESVEHAERWGRFSFLGRAPARTFVTRGNHVEWLDGLEPPAGVPTDRGTLAALEALCKHYRAPKLPELP